ncbi:hypothetical protein NSND_62911 [Nitrospira sp. ND1]|nr:hypothetical protein NSND_62911 [Nitrospira sp. ND1]
MQGLLKSPRIRSAISLASSEIGQLELGWLQARPPAPGTHNPAAVSTLHFIKSRRESAIRISLLFRR